MAVDGAELRSLRRLSFPGDRAVKRTGFRVLLALLMGATFISCTDHTVHTAVHAGPRVSVGFEVKEAGGAIASVGVTYRTPTGVVSSDAITPWHSPVLSIEEGSQVQIHAIRTATEGHSGSLNCVVDTFGGAFLMEVLVTARDSCSMKGVVSLSSVYNGAYGPRS